MLEIEYLPFIELSGILSEVSLHCEKNDHLGHESYFLKASWGASSFLEVIIDPRIRFECWRAGECVRVSEVELEVESYYVSRIVSFVWPGYIVFFSFFFFSFANLAEGTPRSLARHPGELSFIYLGCDERTRWRKFFWRVQQIFPCGQKDIYNAIFIFVPIHDFQNRWAARNLMYCYSLQLVLLFSHSDDALLWQT